MRKKGKISNWSGYPVVESYVHSFRTGQELRRLLEEVPRLIPRGAGLSYGDASLADHVLSTLRYNKIIEFNEVLGIIRCEAGVTLDELLKVIVPHGWFLPVTPGTRFITMGGAIAADVHGKNHHKEGSISRYVNQLTMMLADGEVVTCSYTENRDLLHSTCGGMGLTGVILEVELRLKMIETAFITQKNIIAKDLESLVELLKTNNHHTYSVAWIDCLARGRKMGRGVLMLGEHALPGDLPEKERKQPLRVHTDPGLRVPFVAPGFLLNRFSVRAFNELYFLKHRLARKELVVHYEPFFYPLDFVKDWNRLYGKRGFLQYQFVIPLVGGEEVLLKILTRISESQLASFLAVLKLLRDSEHCMGFPMPGYTLSLDLPVTPRLFTLLDELDAMVADSGGRIYLAKDARMKSETFARSYPGISQFRDQLESSGAHMKFESQLSRRLQVQVKKQLVNHAQEQL